MDLPKELLQNVYWAFYQKFETQEEFEAALIKYNDIPSKRLPPLDRIMLPVQKVVIQYPWVSLDEEEDEDDDIDWDSLADDDPRWEIDEEDKQFVIDTINPAGFTLGELMYKINQGACTPMNGSSYDLSDQDHHFFEGLEFLTDDDPDFPGVPVYYMILGS
ncbi:hypothetical protein BST97_07200 [Nonlabens spongiae]|uniref:Uncharacterized protein n=1 Tax=Nonlabens spongiae TaxID=331648 RepID=A0A1W6MJQ0_9FLAO|nr:hypothetical protein [Nonlabens spongiae]ARN77802.1 hypothetical protein BST97_07200 [Nonlabens spongiae]